MSCRVALVASALAVYGQTWHHEFLSWDDDVHILENPWLNPVSVQGILRFWREPYEGLYIPLSYTFFGVELAISDALIGRGVEGAPDPRLFQLGSLLLHVGNVLLVFSILRLLGARSIAAGCGALVFSLHPLQAESVAWLSETRGLLCAFLSLLAIRSYVLFALAGRTRGEAQGAAEQTVGSSLVDAEPSSQDSTPLTDPRFPAALVPAAASLRSPQRPTLHYALALTFFVLALFAKPAAVAVPVILLALDAILLGRPWKKVAAALSGWLVPVAVFVVLTRAQQSDMAASAVAPLWARPLIAADALAFYLGKLALPRQLAFDYGRSPAFVMRTAWFYWAWLVPTLAVVLLWRLKAGRVWWAAGGVFVAGVAPVLGLIPFAYQATSTVADRYVYLAMLGPALAVAALAEWWCFVRGQGTAEQGAPGGGEPRPGVGSSAVFPALFAVVIACMAGVTFRQTSYWSDDAALYARGLSVNPESAVAHNNLGNALLKTGDLEGALERFRRAVELSPEFPRGHYNLGLALARRGDLTQAAAHLQRSVELEPRAARTHYDLAVVLERQDRPGEAMPHYQTAVRLNPDDAESHNNLAGLYLAQGDSSRAIEHLRAALGVRPGWITALDNLAAACLVRGEIDQAVEHLQAVLNTDPAHGRANFNLGVVRLQQGRFVAAGENFARVLRAEPANLDARLNLAMALLEQQRFAEAIAHFDVILRLEPDLAQAYYHRAEALFRRGEKERAVDDLQKAFELVPADSEPAELIRDRLAVYRSAEIDQPQPARGEVP